MANEMNSAELEAEGILKAEFERMQDDDYCPMGDDCCVHHRVDGESMDDEAQYGMIVTYLGEYAVMTSDNPELSPAELMARLVFSLRGNLPDAYETVVIRVGKGTLADVGKLPFDDQADSIRYVETHNEWGDFRDTHEAIVSAVEAGLIDLSRPIHEGK